MQTKKKKNVDSKVLKPKNGRTIYYQNMLYVKGIKVYKRTRSKRTTKKFRS